MRGTCHRCGEKGEVVWVSVGIMEKNENSFNKYRLVDKIEVMLCRKHARNIFDAIAKFVHVREEEK